jgi:Kef-type K+ transport system membrane component KefB
MLHTFTAAPHHDVLVLIVQIAILLFAARAMGEIAQRLGQPAVVGEILSGIVLGPSLLSSLVPALGVWIVPQTEVQGYLLEVVSLIGVMFLLLITGLETDLALIRRKAGTAAGASLGGVVVPFATGLLLGWYLPDSLLASTDQRLVFALFVATAMSISAIPVIAKVLMDMNLMRRDIGQTIIAAGMTDDAIGWVLLSIVAGLAAGESVTAGSVAQAVGSVVFFMILSFTFGRWLVKRTLDLVQDEVISRDRLLTLVVVLTFAWGAITQALNLEAVLGAFFMGILFGQMARLPHEVVEKIESVALGVFVPIFFAVAGLKVDVRGLLTPQLIGVAILVIFVASFGKVVGTYVGARVIGRTDHWTALSLGAGMNARGAMEIIIATIGLSLGILSQNMYSIIVLMAVATSLMAPPALRWTLSHVVPERQELERLEQEKLREGSRVARIHRVLLPLRQRPEKSEIERITKFTLQRLGERNALSITLLTISKAGNRAEGAAFLAGLGDDFPTAEVTRKVVESDDPVGAIVDEAGKHYDLVVVGATERADDEAVFHPLIDELVRMAPCPTLVVRGSSSVGNWPPRRILVPTNGSSGSRGAAEVAFALASDDEAEVMILNGVQHLVNRQHPQAIDQLDERALGAGWRMVEELRSLGRSQGVRVRSDVRTGAVVEEIVLGAARDDAVDLIVLGTDVRAGSGRLFLGPRVERILSTAPCPVLVINGV